MCGGADESVPPRRWPAGAPTRGSVAEREPGLVPVAKGNGYGFGLGRLARRTQWLGVPMLAVGTYDEIAAVASRFDGSIMVLTLWREFQHAPHDDRLVHTVSRLSDLEMLAAGPHRPRVVLERATSMLRHGMTAAELRQVGRVLGSRPGVRVEGVTMHLPLGGGSHQSEVDRLMHDKRGRRRPRGARHLCVSPGLSRTHRLAGSMAGVHPFPTSHRDRPLVG
ncbi:MAG: alanine racemase [Marmoricola sp.]